MINIRDRINILMLKHSTFFDSKYYKQENPEISGDLAKHYYYFGYKEGRNPSEKFDNDYYLDVNKDVKDAGINPLIHYIKNGKKENRKIKKFDGLSISKIYQRIYNKMYYANINCVVHNQNVSIIVDDLNKEKFDIVCNIMKNVSVSKVIYVSGDDSSLKNLSSRIKLERYYHDYYLEIGINDINICLDRQSLVLFNNSAYVSNIYFYLSNEVLEDFEFVNYLSYYASIEKIKLLSNNDTFKINKTVINDNFIFDNSTFFMKYNFLLGIEIIDNYVLNNCISDNAKMYYGADNCHFKISLRNGTILFPKMDLNRTNNIYFNEYNVCDENGNIIIDFHSKNYLKIYDLGDVL